MNAQAIQNFIFSKKNAVSLGLAALTGIVLFVAQLTFSYWYLVVAVVYGISLAVVPAKKELSILEQSRKESEELIAQMNAFIEKVIPELSPDVQTLLKVLNKKVQRLLPLLDQLNGGSEEVHTIKRTVTTYLPDMLKDYMELPKPYRRQHKMECGRTPKEELMEQIKVLDKEMDVIIGKATSNKMTDLKIHGQFLTQKYEKRDSWFK